MHIEPALLTAIAALIGAIMGGSASLASAIYTQRRQNRLQRIVRESTKRETVYADFIMTASKLLLKAQMRDEITLGGDEQQLIGLMDRMRLFAPPNVIDEAEAVIRAIIETWLKPSVEPRKLAVAALSGNPVPDPLLSFSLACRSDLDTLHRTVICVGETPSRPIRSMLTGILQICMTHSETDRWIPARESRR